MDIPECSKNSWIKRYRRREMKKPPTSAKMRRAVIRERNCIANVSGLWLRARRVWGPAVQLREGVGTARCTHCICGQTSWRGREEQQRGHSPLTQRSEVRRRSSTLSYVASDIGQAWKAGRRCHPRRSRGWALLRKQGLEQIKRRTEERSTVWARDEGERLPRALVGNNNRELAGGEPDADSAPDGVQ